MTTRSSAAGPRRVPVPYERLGGWFSRYDAAHPGTDWRVAPDLVTGLSPDGTAVRLAVPFPPLAEGDPSLARLLAHLERPWRLGVLLVRRGGFAVAQVRGAEVTDSKVGKRHVQGRTKAGDWSQHRFSRRRDNQAKAAFDAAAEHAVRILAPASSSLDLLVTGGDRNAVEAVLAHRELSALSERPQLWVGGLADPRRDVLLSALKQARSVTVEITDPPLIPLPKGPTLKGP